MNRTIGVILAAGRGSRMKGLTDARPKCLLQLAGKPLLHWQLAALRAAGVADVLVVRGYLAHLLQGDFATVDNPRWEQTNMVQSLMCALPQLNGADMLVSYADIVYCADHVRQLLACPRDICLTYDTQWEALWRLRQNDNPLDDAETFREEGGTLLEIGGKPQTLDDVHGQYMGLLKFSPRGQQHIQECVQALSPEKADKLDMTSLLRLMLAGGATIGAVPVHGGWCECDTEEDIRHYENELAKGSWGHDWRENRENL